MFKPLFVTGTGTGVGKTHTVCGLIDIIARRGFKVAGFKPIETGVKAEPEDGLLLRAAMGKFVHNPVLLLDTICPVRYELAAAPDVARVTQAVDWGAIDAAFKVCQEASDIVIIEGAGGALTPVENERYSYDIAKRYNARLLVITDDTLGMIHNLLCTIETLSFKGFINPMWAVSIKNKAAFAKISEPFLTKKFGNFMRLPGDLFSIADKVCH
ncbi:MAG: dethiobiotin synthase [Helicobacteraceae bacterium]|jgi:dethiobiotin synthetase|nr:dethiobiotin synthase [Helicobacteraceae bacterium]